MPNEVILPRVDMDMTEGMIAAWHVKDGDEVREGMLIFEIETSKATMEIDAPASGIIRQISAPVGKMVPVGMAVAWIYAAGEALVEHGEPGAFDGEGSAAPLESVRETGATEPVAATDTAGVLTAPESYGAMAGRPALVVEQQESSPQDAMPDAQPDTPQPLRATPAARRVAREHGLQLVGITGSGPHGRVAAQDVLRQVQQMGLAGGTQDRGVGTSPAILHSITLRKGPGEPLVLVHGFASESNSWRPFAQALARIDGFQPGMLAVDLPAHGKSSAEAAGSLEEMVEALAQTLLDAGITRCHLVGHSFGGAVALATAAKTQATASRLQVNSLTLLAPAGLGPESNGPFMRGVTQATQRASLEPWLRQLFADPSRLDEGFIATAAQQLERAEVRERLATVAERFFPDGTQVLDVRHLFNDLTMPVRVVWGQQDRILPARHTEGLPGHVAVHRFAGVGHLPYMEAQMEVARIVAQNIAAGSMANSRDARDSGACAAAG